jgi:hypothetical protein
VVIYTDYDLILYGGGIILLFITTLQYLGMARKKENPNEKLIDRAYGIVFIGLTIQFSLLVLYFLSLEGFTVDHSYWGIIELENISLLSEWLYRGSWIPNYTIMTIFIYAGEKIRNKKLRVVSPILGIVNIFLAIFLPFEIFTTLGTIPLVILFMYFCHVLFLLMKWAKKELKAATSFIIFGTLLIANPTIFANPNIMMAGVISSILLPLSLILAVILCMAPTFVNPKFFLRATSYWYLFFASLIGYSVFLFIVAIIFLPQYLILEIFIMIIFYSLESAIFLKSFLKEEGVSTKKSFDIIGVFTRPETITEEEVSVSKEKKICLVCKKEVLRANYICPECKTFYCKNCSETLSNLENMCWVCDTPFDESKPSKPFKKESEGQEVVVEESAPKKDVVDTK